MRKLYVIFFPLVWLSCSSSSNYEQTIIDYLETDKKGVKTDLQIEILSLEISDILVSDSIAILQRQFETEKAKKIELAQAIISRLQSKIEEQKGKKNQVVAKALISNWEKDLERANNELLTAQEWEANYLTKYKNRNASELLAKKADCKFSFFNPQLQTRQEVKALFIISSDGKRCVNMIKQ